MASICEDFPIDAPPAEVWSALRDFHAVHKLLVPGFVIDSRPQGDDVRVVTFFNGAVARERLVTVDDDARRLVYSVIEGPLNTTHHNASAQVFDAGEGRSRFVWTTDLLPDGAAPRTRELMAHGAGVIKRTLEALRA